MKRHAESNESTRSLKTLFLFLACVTLLIVISLSIRLFFLFKESTFDGSHRYTIVIRHSSRELDIVTFEPKTKSMGLFTLTSKKDIGSIQNTLGIPIDGVIIDKNSRITRANITGKFYGYMLRITAGKNVNSLDLFRLNLFLHGISRRDITDEKIEIKESSVAGSVLADSFYDQEIIDEGKTVAIINAAGYPGLGSRVERILSSLGVNVVSVTTAQSVESTSNMEYSDVSSYTLSRLSKTFPFPVRVASEEGISDILIVLGEDSVDFPLH